MTHELAKWYFTYFKATNFILYRGNFMAILSTPSVDKAFVMLAGEMKLSRDNHMRYLWRFPKNEPYRKKILKKIDDLKLWKISFAGFKSFEDLYDYVWDSLNNPKIPQIGQLVIYDVALHLAYIEGTNRLMPKDLVYLHALPHNAYEILLSKGVLPSSFKKSSTKIDLALLVPLFPGLTAYQIEDLFCQIGKSIRRIKNGTIPKTLAEKDIDNILKKYITLP
jgi:hypothetical protein